MEQKTSPELANPEPPPDYRQKLEFEFEKRRLHISPETLEICSEQLQYLDNVYAARYLYHNGAHSFDDTERGLILLDRIGKHIPIAPKDYALLTLITTYHDDKIHDDQLTGRCAEEESAITAIGAMASLTEYDSTDCVRVKSGIMVSRATYDSSGVHQPELLADDRDVLRFVTALADIGAILMEGKDRMVKDVTNLALEQYARQDNPMPMAVLNTLDSLLKMQSRFINERLHDLDQAIPHYFGSYGSEIEEAIRNEIHSLIDTNLQELRPILRAIDTKQATISRLIHEKIDRSDIQSPDILQQKISGIIDEVSSSNIFHRPFNRGFVCCIQRRPHHERTSSIRIWRRHL